MATRSSWLSSRAAVLVPLAIALLATAGCFPNPPKDDESQATFAREVIPVLLGRRAHGVDEVEAVADVAQLLGREAAVRMLMKDEAFVDHWSDMLIDMLQMQRDPEGGLAAQDATCWGAPTRPDPDPAIAQWVRDHAPTDAGAPTPAWNMTDLLRSAIALDDLSPVYRANLFTVSMRRAGGNGGTTELANGLLRVYLNRDVTCLRCHNPTLSASNKVDSGGNIVWRRLWTIPGHPEKALFGNYYDATSATTRILPIMRGDVRKPAAGGLGTRPWGMAEACTTDTNTASSANNGTTTHRGFQTLGAGAANNPGAGFGSLDGAVNPKVSLWELEGSLRTGVNNLKNGYERFAAAAPLLPPEQQKYCDAVQVFSSSCVGCHPPSGSLDLSSDPAGELVNVNTASAPSTNAKRVVPNSTATSELWRRVNAGAGDAFLMPFGGPPLPAASKTKIQDWINAGAPSIDTASCNTSSIPDVHPDEAFAFLTAANIVDGIWLSTMGYRLTIDHGYSRNADQRDMLWNLTEYTFVPNNWSLKAVLVKVLSSNWYARRAPTISQRSTRLRNAAAARSVGGGRPDRSQPIPRRTSAPTARASSSTAIGSIRCCARSRARWPGRSRGGSPAAATPRRSTASSDSSCHRPCRDSPVSTSSRCSRWNRKPAYATRPAARSAPTTGSTSSSRTSPLTTAPTRTRPSHWARPGRC